MDVPSGIYLLKLKSTKKTQEQSVRPQRRIQNLFEHQTKTLSKKHEAVCYYHVMYAFQSESTFHSCLNVKGTPRTKQGNIWSLNDELVWPNGWVNQLRKWLNVPLRTKWLWVQISLLTLKDEIFSENTICFQLLTIVLIVYTNLYKCVLRTQLNSYDKGFCENS